jgi:hypothetical protein
MTIAFGVGQVLDHRAPHGFRRAKAEQRWVADVQLDDLVTFALELRGATSEWTANLVPDIAQVSRHSNVRR